MKTHIVDWLDNVYKLYLHQNNNIEPNKLFLTPDDLANLKEYLGLDFLNKVKNYHGCQVIVKENLKESYYE